MAFSLITTMRERGDSSIANERLEARLSKLRDARKKLESGGSKAVESDRMTFSDLAEYCAKEIYVAADYRVAGQSRTLPSVRSSTSSMMP
jgi:hypothetical protein